MTRYITLPEYFWLGERVRFSKLGPPPRPSDGAPPFSEVLDEMRADER